MNFAATAIDRLQQKKTPKRRSRTLRRKCVPNFGSLQIVASLIDAAASERETSIVKNKKNLSQNADGFLTAKSKERDYAFVK